MMTTSLSSFDIFCRPVQDTFSCLVCMVIICVCVCVCVCEFMCFLCNGLECCRCCQGVVSMMEQKSMRHLRKFFSFLFNIIWWVVFVKGFPGTWLHAVFVFVLVFNSSHCI